MHGGALDVAGGGARALAPRARSAAAARARRHAQRINRVACNKPATCCLTPPPPSASPAPSSPCAARNRCGCKMASALVSNSTAFSKLYKVKPMAVATAAGGRRAPTGAMDGVRS